LRVATELLFRDDAYLRQCSARVVAASGTTIELDRTVFYPMGGGQPGDTGFLRRADESTLPIIDTRRSETGGAVLHHVAEGAQLPQPGELVDLVLDWDRRYAHMRIHTSLHVLSCVVVAPVTGGNITADRGRLDFDIDMSLLDAARIETGINELIARAVATETVWISDAELEARPELVKTMSVQPPRGQGRVRLLRIPGIDLQPCGGTHVGNIGEIGAIKVLRIRNEGRRNKRVEVGFA
jgi:misacylated tRNA(Ala) deacylase